MPSGPYRYHRSASRASPRLRPTYLYHRSIMTERACHILAAFRQLFNNIRELARSYGPQRAPSPSLRAAVQGVGEGGGEGGQPDSLHGVPSAVSEAELDSDCPRHAGQVVRGQRANPPQQPLLAGRGDLVGHDLLALAGDCDEGLRRIETRNLARDRDHLNPL